MLVDAVSGEARLLAAFPTLAVPPPPMPGMPGTPLPLQSAPITAADHLIPSRNPSSLWAYYSSIAGILCCLPTGVVSIIFGIKGLKEAKIVGVGKTHSLVGIILGSLETLCFLALWILVIIGIITDH